MSSILDITVAHNNARLAATLAGADNHVTQHSYVDLYDTERPSSIDEEPGDTAVVRLILAKPLGTITDGVLTLLQQDPTGDLIARDSPESGLKWGRWYTATGVRWADGDVSDEAGDGFWKLGGTTGTRVFAGGRTLMGLVTLE